MANIIQPSPSTVALYNHLSSEGNSDSAQNAGASIPLSPGARSRGSQGGPLQVTSGGEVKTKTIGRGEV